MDIEKNNRSWIFRVTNVIVYVFTALRVKYQMNYIYTVRYRNGLLLEK